MSSPLRLGLVLGTLAVLLASSPGWGKERRRGRAARGARVAQNEQQRPATPPASLAPAALRVECGDGMQPAQCEAVQEAAREAAQKSYRLLEPRRLEELFVREPALRTCRLEECRVAITDQLGVPRLIDVHVHSQAGGRGGAMVGSVSIYDAVAKGISGDTDAPLGRRDEKHMRKIIADAVEYVIGAQRLTASLHLDIQPEGATVKIDDKDRGAVREVKLFLGPHRVRVEKLGYLPVERTVNVTPAGTREQIRLAPQPIRVLFEIQPPGTRVLIDGDPMDARTNVVELTEGRHRVQALAPPDSGYDSLDFEVDVRVGMPPVRRVLPRLAQLRIRAPLGYVVRVDNQMMAPGTPSGLDQDLIVTTGPGTHAITAENWRGRTLRTTAQLVSGTAADIHLRPPSLVPGLVLAGAGLLAIAGGGAMVGLHDRCINAVMLQNGMEVCERFIDFSWSADTHNGKVPTAGILALAAGGAAVIGGTIWFAINAADHPLFNKKARRQTGRLPGVLAAPVLAPAGGALVVQGRF